MTKDRELIQGLVFKISPALVADSGRYSELWDLDEIFWKDYPKPWSIERALGAFDSLIECYSPWSGQLIASLQIWLGQTINLVATAPKLDLVTSLDVSTNHPPSVVLSKRIRPVPVPYEMYRVPVHQYIMHPREGEVRAYYECFRTFEALSMDEPYDRIIVLQHCPGLL